VALPPAYIIQGVPEGAGDAEVAAEPPEPPRPSALQPPSATGSAASASSVFLSRNPFSRVRRVSPSDRRGTRLT
jgi:hypothetical protein